MKKIYLDLDCVLADLMTPWIDWLNKEGFTIDRREITHWEAIYDKWGEEANEFFKNPDIYNKNIVSPFEGVRGFIASLKMTVGEDNIYIITSSPDNVKSAKVKWINRHLGIDVFHVIHSQQKHLHTDNGILVDDYYNNILKHSLLNNQPSIMFNLDELHPYANIKWVPVLGNVYYCTGYGCLLKKILELI